LLADSDPFDGLECATNDREMSSANSAELLGALPSILANRLALTVAVKD